MDGRLQWNTQEAKPGELFDAINIALISTNAAYFVIRILSNFLSLSMLALSRAF